MNADVQQMPRRMLTAAQSALAQVLEESGVDIPHIEIDRVLEASLKATALSDSIDAGLDVAIRTCAALIEHEPEYSRFGANLLARQIRRDLERMGVCTFADFVALASSLGLLEEKTERLFRANLEQMMSWQSRHPQWPREYLGLRTLSDRYLLRHPVSRGLIEAPEFFLLRAAAGLSDTIEQAQELYELLSSGSYMSSNLVLAGTRHAQLCSCFLIDSPEDSIHGIYDGIKDVALISKSSGGVGQAYHAIRSRGSTVRSTNGVTRGIVPWLKVLDSSVSAVDQGGRRKGAACIYLETWHADIEEFLCLRENTGEEESRTYNLQLANWIPDLFMRRVAADHDWSLFDPADVPELRNLWGSEFDVAYVEAERAGKAKRAVSARRLYGRMVRALGETGNGWMTFKDACNRKCNQTARPENVVHLSNLCTEIVEVTSAAEIAVCTLGSINLAQHMTEGGIDFGKLAATTRVAIRQLDRVVDRTVYPLQRARDSNLRWRPLGLGMMGLQDVLFAMRLPFDSPQAQEVSTSIAECIYFHALSQSCDLAREWGSHPAYAQTRTAAGVLQFDLWDNAAPSERFDWKGLREKIREHGLRNSLLIAIAPTATIASIAGCYESIEPQFSNVFRRETSSGEFVQVNRYLVEDLRRRGLWDDEMRESLRNADGSIQGIERIPAKLRSLYRTVWEIPQKALIDAAAARGPFIDQSQSLNLYLENPTLDALSSMYMYAWKAGLKTTYYMRSRSASSIGKTAGRGAARPKMCAAGAEAACEACE